MMYFNYVQDQQTPIYGGRNQNSGYCLENVPHFDLWAGYTYVNIYRIKYLKFVHQIRSSNVTNITKVAWELGM
jgi:hypothetical protein